MTGHRAQSRKMPLANKAYRLAMSALGLVAEPYLAWRARKGKEDPDRKDERFGRAGTPRPQGRIGWIHAASVGESVSVLPLIKRLLDFGDIDHLVVTTGTVTSAEIMAARLPAGAVHQYVPLDCPSFVAGFIDHWRPDFAMFVESEIWPNMYAALEQRQIPAAIINGRMSARSFKGWQRHRGFMSRVLATTEICIAQNLGYAHHFAQLGAPNVVALGNIKFDSPPLPASEGDLSRLVELTKLRPVWLAASTHRGEEEAIADVHISMRDKYPDLLTILAPRHPERGEEVATLLEDRWLATARRSTGAEPRAMIDVYVADTIGELGLFYRLCPFAFIGGSLTGIGGHNPVEAANLECAVLHGPHIQNFRDMFETFDAAGAALEVADAGQLFTYVDQLTANPAQAKTMAAAGGEVLRVNAGALDRAIAALGPILAPRRAQNG
ncbi:3-deoxy-D-manno-octulosonic acid transferase [hydrothermal vent metagenome]|uniref:lipid IVA 3-deoxy-D-manno-octulosonic acid transferase n=1 Tax=hydrothermal vent metagenome TaxID=652676 RepID=A0A3B0UB83_9ZZZZ